MAKTTDEREGAWEEMLEAEVRVQNQVNLLLTAARAFVVLCAVMLPVLLVDLIWVGIVHGGVRSAVPLVVPADELSRAEQGLSPEQVRLVEDRYSQPDVRGVRHFAGRPEDLRPFSPLSRTLALQASGCCGGAWGALTSLHLGTRWAQRQYQLVGYDGDSMRACYVLRILKEMLGCLVVTAVGSATLRDDGCPREDGKRRHTLPLFLVDCLYSCVGRP